MCLAISMLDGTGEPWDHDLDGWAHRNSSTGPDGNVFVLNNWSFSGPNALDGELLNATATSPVPVGTFIPTIISAINTYTIDVTALSSMDYTFAGDFSGADPVINMNLGDTLVFNVNTPGHPFWINDLQGTGTANGVTVADNGTTSGVITWTPTSAGTYYYNCEFHSMMTNTITVGPPAISYTWDNGVTNGVSFTPTASDDYIVVASDPFGCTDTETVTVTVNSNPTVDAGADQTVCEGEPVTLSGTGASSYTWDNGVSDGVVFNATNTTTYNVIGTDANGCENTDEVVVNINSLPTVGAGADQTVCEGVSVTLSGSGAVGSPPYSYLWGNGVTDGVAFNATTTTTYIVTVADANGCENTDEVDVVVNPNPIPTINGVSEYCTGTSALLSTVNPYDTYLWSTGDVTATSAVTASDNPISVTVTNTFGCSSTSAVFSVSENTVITYNSTETICQGDAIIIHGNSQSDASVYSETFSLGTGCDSISNVTLVVNALPTVVAGANQAICEGEIVTLSGSGASSYTWDNGVIENTPFTPTLGTVTYTLTGTDANGCVNTDVVDLTVNALPIVDAGIDQAVCEGDPVTLSGAGASSYTWDNGVVENTPFTPTLGTVTYTLTGTDANGCVNTDVVDLTVNALPIVDAGIDQAVCEGDPVTLSGAGASSYTWDNGVSDGVAFNATTTTTYNVIGTDANGCENTDEVIVSVNSLPTVSAGADQTVCEGDPVTLSGAGASSYTWDNGVSDGVAFNATTTTTYNVIGTDANGCENTDEVIVSVNSLPTVSAGADQTICSGDPITLSGTGASSYAWDNGVTDGVAFTPLSTTTYTVTGTDVNGCSNTDALSIVVDECSGISDFNPSNLTIYPNPTADQITIDIKGYNGGVNVEVYDLQGRLLESTTNTKVSLKKHAKGIYVLKVSYGEITEEIRVVRD